MGNFQPHGPGKIQNWAFSLPSFFQNTLETSKINHSSVQKNSHSKITSIRGRGYVILQFTGALWKAYALVKKNLQKKGSGGSTSSPFSSNHPLFHAPSQICHKRYPKVVVSELPSWEMIKARWDGAPKHSPFVRENKGLGNWIHIEWGT